MGDTRKHRKRLPPPREGWLSPEALALTGVSMRSFRNYRRAGLIETPPLYGNATRYSRKQVLKLAAILAIQAEKKTKLSDIRARLETMSDAELEAYAPEEIKLPEPLPSPAIAADATSPAVEAQTSEQPHTFVTERWQKISLVAGLDLIITGEPTPALSQLAQRIFDLCRGVL